MKNVAKCDTWCELQNPVNHQVFERKLRPKPLGQGHVCLGVTHRVAPPLSRGGRIVASRAPGHGWPKCESGATDVTTSGGCFLNSRAVVRDPVVLVTYETPDAPVPSFGGSLALRPRPQVRRDYPLSLSISISGGKETYKDSPSNGERTGNSPA